MEILNSHQVIQNCIKRTQSSIERVRKTFSLHSVNQLNLKLSPGTWSIGECFSHLVNSNSLYLTKIENILTSFSPRTEINFTYKQSFVGKFIAEGVDPGNVRKTKTFKVFFPDTSNIQISIIDDYIKSCEKFIELAGSMRSLDLKKIKLSSPANKFIRLNLGDPLIIIPKHDERHLNQAEGVMSQKEFPTKTKQ